MIAERARLFAIAMSLCPLVAFATPATAQQSEHEHTGAAAYRVGAVRVTEAPVLDGVLDDAVWESAALIDQFVQQEPAEGEPATERTEVRVMYDATNLYLGLRAYDSRPDAIIATEMRRDSERLLEEDNFQVILDTFKDSRSAYMFVTSPLGARLDQQVFEEGEGGRSRGGAGNINSNINRDWDGVWHVSSRRTAEGWQAEIAIPVVTLRFPDSDVQEWGINFMRNIRHKNEQVFWAPIPKAYSITRVSLAGTLTEMSALSRGRDLRIKPALIGGGRRVSETGEVDNSWQRDLALDVKYGITAGLNLDVTVNTDFAQAEVDDERVNLTRFALFFPEKREFFLENAGQFNVGTTASLDRAADLFFSRRIGLTETGGRVPILGGARLTGKIGRNNIAIMDLQTDDAFERPGENYLVARYSRDVFGRSKIGAIVVNKEATGGGPEGNHFNRTFAADMTLAPLPNLSINGFLARTATPDVDSDQTGAHLRAAWLSTSWNVYSEFTDLDDNFNAEVGFVPRVGIRTYKIHVERTPRPGRLGIRLMEPMHNTTYTTDQSGRLLSRRLHNMLGTRFENGSYLNVFYNHYFERLDDPFRIQGVEIAPGGYTFGEWNFMFRSNPAARVYYTLGYSPQDFYDGERTDMNASLGVRVNSRLSAESGYTRNDVKLSGGEFTLDVGSLRLDYALSPTMTLRTLTQYNSSTDQWSTSARFNWIYRPGSDIYLVYDDVRRDIPGQIEGFSERQLLLKVTYLLSR